MEDSPIDNGSAPSTEDVEDTYRILVDLAPDVIYRLDRHGVFTALSPAFRRITGWEPAEWLGKSFAGMIHPSDLAHALDRFGTTLSGACPPPFELQVRSAGGEYLVGEFTSIPVTDAGEVTGVVGIARDVTARHRAERDLEATREELQQSRDQLAIILQSVVDGITVQDLSGRLIYANAAGARLAGFRSPAEMMQVSVPDVLDTVDAVDAQGRQLTAEALPGRRALMGEQPDPMEVGFRNRATGELRWWTIRATPVLDDSGQVASAVTVFQDITEHKLAGDVRSELAAIVESSSDAVLGLDLDGAIRQWNDGAERLYGWRGAEVVGRSIATLVPTDRTHELEDILARVRAGERIENFDGVRLHRSGGWLDVSLSMAPIRGADGEVRGAAVIARDVTAQRRGEAERTALLQAEQEARERAELARGRLAFLAEASGVLSASLDYETTLASVARIAVPSLGDWCTIDLLHEGGVVRRVALAHTDPERIRLAEEMELRYAPVEGDGQPLPAVMTTGRSQLINDITDEMLRSTARDEEHLQVIRSLGLTSAMVVPLTARGRILGSLSFVSAESGTRFTPEDLALVEELARRVAVAVDNARLYQQAQEALRLREEFLSIASHELKTPLTALQLQMQLMERLVTGDSKNEDDDERIERMVGGARRQMRRLGRLINDLLDVSRIGAGRLAIERQDVDLLQLARDVVVRFSNESASTGVDIRVHGDSSVVAALDRFQIDQVLTNVLSNALKYGDGKPVDVTVQQSGAMAQVVVRDQGIGIEAEHLPRVFDRFERVARSSNYGGLGLGLYIAQQIVDLHHGKISVVSEPGDGSTFTVELPLRPPDVAAG